MPTRSAPVRTGNYLNSPASIAPFLLFPQITNRNKTSRLRDAPLRTHALPVATLSSSSPIKCYGLATDYTVPLLILTRSVIMGTASVMTRGTRTDRLESTSNPFSCRLLQPARTFSSTQESLLTGNFLVSLSSRLLLRPGTPQTSVCLVRGRLQRVLSTVYQPLDGTYGPNRRHPCRRSPQFWIHVVLLLFLRTQFSCTVHLRGHGLMLV